MIQTQASSFLQRKGAKEKSLIKRCTKIIGSQDALCDKVTEMLQKKDFTDIDEEDKNALKFPARKKEDPNVI